MQMKAAIMQSLQVLEAASVHEVHLLHEHGAEGTAPRELQEPGPSQNLGQKLAVLLKLSTSVLEVLCLCTQRTMSQVW